MRLLIISLLTTGLLCLTIIGTAQVQPVITGQVVNPMQVLEDQPLTIQLSDLLVTDSDNTYPDDFTLAVAAGTNYTVVGNTITPSQDFNGTLVVMVTVNDGTQDSDPYGVNVQVNPVDDAPTINGQNPLSTLEETQITVQLSDLNVSDVDNTYPTGFSLTLSPGVNYTVSGNTVTPNLDFNGILTVATTVSDGTTSSSSFNLMITVTPVNDPPVINGQNAMTTAEETPITIQFANLNVTDVDNTYPTGFTLTPSAGANYSLSGNVITPSLNFSGTLSVPVVVNDGAANSNIFNLQITVTPVNDAPVITGQNPITINEDTPVTIQFSNLLVTDVDNTYPTGFTLTASGGTNYTVNSNVVTPASNFSGTLSVPVIVNDGAANSNSFNLQITVTAVNDAPVITGQTAVTTNEDTPVTLQLSNLTVTDPDNIYPTDFTLTVSPGANYTASGNIVTPAANFSGTLTLNVTVNDGLANSNTFAFHITVTPVNDPPVITGQNPLSVNENQTITLHLADLTVSDPDNTYPTGFTFTISGGANYTFSGGVITPAVNYFGVLTVPVIVNDGTDNSANFNVSITVNHVNVAPTITGQNSVSTNEDTPITIVTSNLLVTDPDNTYPTGFSMSIAAGANYTFTGTTVTPNANYNGTLSVPVKVNDGAANSNTFNLQITVTPVNDAPVITGQSTLSVNENQTLTLALANFFVTDVDNTYPTGFSFAIQAGSNYTAAGAVVTPATNYSGTLSVPVTVNDGTSNSAPFTLTITVNPVNVAPIITGQNPVSTSEDSPVVISLANLLVSDPDDTYPGAFTMTLSAGANYTFSGATVTPAANFNGTLSVPVKVNDGQANSNSYSLQITVTPVNDAPVITGQQALTTNEDVPLTLQFSNLTVTDIDNPYPTGFTINILPGSNYTASGNVITPALNYNGILSVGVTVNDGSVNSNTFSVSITVTPVNDPPVITGQNSVSTAEDTPITIPFSALQVTDVDNTYPTGFTMTLSPGANYTFSGSTVTPALNFNGILSVGVVVGDGAANSNSFNLQIQVTPVDDAPVITGQVALNTNEDTPITLALANLTVTDVDNTYPTGFTLSVLSGSNYTSVGRVVTPALNYNGTISVNVTVNDGSMDSSPFAVQITVNPVNDAPVITGQSSLTTGDGQPIQLLLSQLTVFDPDNSYPTGFSLSVLSGSNYSVTGDVVTPSVGFSGNLPVRVFVNDGQTNSAFFTLTIQVNYTNKPPVITGQNPVSINEDTPLTIKVTDLTITDPDNVYPGDFSVTVQSGTNYTFSGNTITPATNFNGTLTVKVIANDGSVNSNVFSLQVTVVPVNDPPVITGQTTVNVAENASRAIVLSDLLVTDVDNPYPSGFSLTVTSGTNYTVSGNTITPALNYFGTLSVPVTVSDGAASSNIFNLAVTVGHVNQAPVITGQNPVSTNEDTPVTIQLSNLLVTDVDNAYPGGFSLALAAGANYTISGNTLTPALNFNGTLSVAVTVNDGAANSNSFVMSVTVNPVDDAPVITGQNPLTTSQNQSFIINLTDLIVTDVDNPYPTGFSLLVVAGTNYTFSGNTVTPALNFSGVLSVKVQVNDGTLNSAVFPVQVNVSHVNAAPVITGQNPVSVNEDTPLTIQFSQLTVTDPDNTYPTGFSIAVAAGTNYTVSGNTITPSLNFNGTISIGVTVNDGTANSNLFNLQVTVNPVNDAPVSKGFAPVAVQEDQSGTISVNLLTVFSDVEDTPDLLTYTIVSNDKPAYFSTIFVSAGQLQFALAPNAFGTAKVTLKAADTGGLSVQDVVTINIAAVNDPPSFDPVADVILTEDATTKTITVSNISAGPLETEQLLFTATSGNTNIIPQPTVVYNGTGTTATVSFTPVPASSGTAVITLKVVDTGLNEFSRTFNVVVNSINDPPTLNPVANVTLLEDAGLQNISLTGITAGPSENQVLTITVATDKPSLFDTLRVVYQSPLTTGILKVKSKDNANGVGVITITVTDDGPNSPPPNKNFTVRTLTYTVTPVNDLPVFTSVPGTLALVGEPFQYSVNVIDVDGDPITLTALQKPAFTTFTNQSNGAAQLAGVPTAIGSSVVKLVAKDPSGTPVEQDFTLIVSARPNLSAFSVTTPEDTPLPLPAEKFVGAFASPAGNPVKEIQFTKVPRHGSLSLNNATIKNGDKVFFSAIQKVVYQSFSNYNGRDTVYWKARDTSAYSLQEAYFNIVITPVNDPPEITALETDSLKYQVGGGPMSISAIFFAQDVDNDSLAGAEIGFRRQNFQTGIDELIYNKGTSTSVIKGAYDVAAGVMTLSGKAPIRDYIDAVRAVQYNITNTANETLDTKTVSITLDDGKALSITKDRPITLVYTFEDLKVPTGFTPDGDGFNPTWKIALPGQAASYPNALVRVYNKRGKVVFESHGLDKEWDGTVNGDLVPADTYYYTIDLNLPFIKKTYKGPLTVLHR